MSFRIIGDPGDPGRPHLQLGRSTGAESGLERRITRHGVQVIAHGALVCPGCDMPLAVRASTPAGGMMRCGFCDHSARAHEFLARDVYDTLANEAQLIARIV